MKTKKRSIQKLLILSLGLGFTGIGLQVKSAFSYSDVSKETRQSQRTYTDRKKVRRSIAESPTQSNTEKKSRDLPVYGEQTGTGFGVFIGGGGGGFWVNPESTLLETQKTGNNLLGRFYFSVYNSHFMIDAGAAWLYSNINGGNSYQQNSRFGLVSSQTQASVQTRVGMFEVSPRIKLGKYFHVGPIATAFFGADSGFSESQNSFDYPIFLGGKGGLNYELKDVHFRLFAQASASLNITQRQATMLSGGLEIGLPLIRGKTVIRETETVTTHRHYKTEKIEEEVEVEIEIEKPVEKIVEKIIEKKITIFVLDDEIVHFEFNQKNLTSKSKKFIHDLGEFLASQPDSWGKITIEGHTDNRGSDEYNDALSLERASEIKQAFEGAGIASDKLEATGQGEKFPIDSGETELSHARNRRVELHFSDIQNPREIRDRINQIRFSTLNPLTCRGRNCR